MLVERTWNRNGVGGLWIRKAGEGEGGEERGNLENFEVVGDLK